MSQTKGLRTQQSAVMQESINNHNELLKAISSAEEAKKYDEAVAKLRESDQAIRQQKSINEESVK